MFKGIYRDSAGKSECGDFKFMEIACIPAIPVILKSPHSDVIFEGSLIKRDTMGIPQIRWKEIMYQLWGNHVII